MRSESVATNHCFWYSIMVYHIIWASFFFGGGASLPFEYILPQSWMKSVFLIYASLLHSSLPQFSGIQVIMVEWICGLSYFWIIIMIPIHTKLWMSRKSLCSEAGKGPIWLKFLNHQIQG